MNLQADGTYDIGVKIGGIDGTVKVNDTWKITSDSCTSYVK